MKLTVEAVDIRDSIQVVLRFEDGARQRKTILSSFIIACTPDDKLPDAMVFGALRAVREARRDHAYNLRGDDWERNEKRGDFGAAPSIDELEAAEHILEEVNKASVRRIAEITARVDTESG